MSDRDAHRLRDLVNDYYHGLITLESYRERRARLLDNIGLDDEGPDVTSRHNRHRPSSGSESLAVAPVADGGSRVPVYVGGAVAAIAIAAGAFFVLQSPDGDAPVNDLPEPAAAPAQISVGEAVLDDFLVSNDWTAESAAALTAAWLSLAAADRERAMTGRRYRQITGHLSQRLREESALGTPANDSRLLALTALADALGVGYRTTQPAIDAAAVEPPGRESPADAPAPATNNGAPAPQAGQIDEPDLAAEQAPEPPVTNELPPPAAADDEPEALQTDAKQADESAAVAAPEDDPCPAAIANTRRPYCQDPLGDGSDGPPLVALPPGQFEMGSNANAAESPRHAVSIAGAVAMSRYEVSVAEYAQYCTSTGLPCPDVGTDNTDMPMVMVSWDDAVGYTQWLSQETGRVYRLPTEAEWEYAARGGTTTPYFFGDEITPANAHSVFNGATDGPLPRNDRRINRNPFRLVHMSGNVREWVQDAWHDNYANAPADGSARDAAGSALRVVRGGSYEDVPSKLRSAAREPLDRTHKDALTGFRIVRNIVN